MMDDSRREDGEDGREPRKHRHRSSREYNSREEQLDRRHRHHHHSHQRHSKRSLSPGEVREAASPRKHRPPSSSHRPSEPTKRSSEPLSIASGNVEHIQQTTSPSPDTPSSSDSEGIGPMPLPETKPTRIPRRSEYGHNPQDIHRFEQMGFVMSGNRKKRKASDDGKKGVVLSREEKALRETEIVRKFREMIEEQKGLQK